MFLPRLSPGVGAGGHGVCSVTLGDRGQQPNCPISLTVPRARTPWKYAQALLEARILQLLLGASVLKAS